MNILRACGAALLCLSLVACDEDGKKSSAGASLPPPLVKAVKLERMDVPLYATFMGQTTGSRSAAVKPQVSGILEKRLFQEGAFVKQGTVLFEIDEAPYRAALLQAEGQLADAASTLDNARKEYDRVQKLYASNAVSRQERDSAYAAWRGAQGRRESAQAAVNDARIRLGYCRVTAPFSGYTSREVTRTGNLVGTDSTLTYLNQSDPMDVEFSVPSVELFSMRDMESQGRAVSYGEGSSADLRLLEGVSYDRQGSVIFLDTQVDSSTSAVRAKARFPNPEGKLLPGQFVLVRVGGARLVGALMIPQEALMQTEKGTAVYVLDEADRASLAPVTLGPAFGSFFLLEEGLKPGQRIVVQGQNKVTPGSAVHAELMIQRPEPDPLDTPDSSQPAVTGGGVEDAPAPVREAGHE
ncbi:efflux RND transporter periplasmic adaptor subunit [uncultured Mailhella sp.]|uniref:efflux RND transporter periplasmic adaptor subunit n=1 Tax=uncultured Mailhella sp. TaxID=1981031 RepID=UPI003209F114